jgi:predicted Zn-dependent protease
MKRFSLAALMPVILLTLACATNPVTGKRQLAMISEAQEIQMGQQAAQQVAKQMGLVQDQALQNYVNQVGQRLAADSERPELPWSFAVVDDPMINAFALPGGPIFLTRGILAHFNNEAEMASVLGHEIGHVTARHSVEQISKQQLAGLGLGIAMILSPQAAQFGDLAGAGLQLMFMKFGRDHERQADSLGLRYMVQEGYDPNQMPPVFDVLDQISRAEGGRAIPEWASTHPDPGNRAAAIRRDIAEAGNPSGVINRDAYLARLDGMMFGTNPREGYTIGSTFYHPDMRFRMQFPQGWRIQNTRQAVIGVSPNQDAVVLLTHAQAQTPEAAARAFFSQQGLQAGQQVQRNVYTFRTAQMQDGNVLQGVAGFPQVGNTVLQLIGYTSASRWNAMANSIGSAVASVQPETNPRYINVEPKRIDVVKVPRRMTLQEFARNYPSTVDLQQLAIINGAVRDGFVFEAGQMAKRVVGGNLPTN